MSAIAIVWLVLKILLFIVLGLLGLILLLLALPFHLSLTGYYDGKELSYDIQVKYAWFIPLDRFIKSRMQPKPKTKPGSAQSMDKPQIPPQEPVTAEKRIPRVNKTTIKPPQEPKTNDFTIQGRKKVNFQEILDWISWGLEQKGMFWRAVLKLFQLLHIRPLLLRGQLGLDDPADTAFLFSTIYTFLPLVPFLAFQVQANYEEQALSGLIRFRCHISLLEIPLTLILNRDLRRTLFLIYRMTRPKPISMKTAEI